MDRKPEILAFLAQREWASGRDVREHLGISRQALNRHLQSLIASGEVIRSGSTRAARYRLAVKGAPPLIERRDLSLEGLDEDRVYEEFALTLGLRDRLPSHVEAILRYAFTEILNNAVDHSASERGSVGFRVDEGSASFEVRDRGTGVFHSIASKLALPDERAAMIELLKGKTTTMPARHSGEGLFFTSKVADRFVLRSHRIQIEWDRAREDVFVSKPRFIAGTDVRFLIRRGTRRRLEDVFTEFAPAEYDYQLEKTRLHVRLLRSDYVSRSEAKRLLANLERFREVVLDFKAVRSVGQGFADEVFRVFPERHPHVKIVPENTNPVVEAMLRHVATGREG